MPIFISGIHTLRHTQQRYWSSHSVQDLLSPLIEHAIQSFGTQRIVFASNFPMDKPNTTLKDLIQAYIEMTAPLGEEAQRAIFRSNAETFYQINKH